MLGRSGPRSREQPQPETPLTFRGSLTDLLRTLQLVWEASPRGLIMLSLLSLLLAFAPAVTLYISKLLLDAVAAAINGSAASKQPSSLLLLLLLQVA